MTASERLWNDLGPSRLSRPLDELQAEFEWLRLRLQLAIARTRYLRALGPPAEYRGVFVPDEEVAALLDAAGTDEDTRGEQDLIAHRAALLRTELDARRETSVTARSILPLERIVSTFDLSAAERLILVAAVAPHVDRAWEKVFVYANDDVTRKRPTVGTLIEALSDSPSEALALRRLFAADAPLPGNGLIEVFEEPGAPPSSLLSMSVEVDRHLAEVLLGHEGLDPRLGAIVDLLVAPRRFLNGMPALARLLAVEPASRIYLGGRWAGERLGEAARASAEAGYRLLQVDTRALLEAERESQLLRLLLRDARMLRAALYFEGWGDDGERNPQADALGRRVERALRYHPLPVLFGGRAARPATDAPDIHLSIAVPGPGVHERASAWHEALGTASDDVVTRLGATFRLGRDEIEAAVHTAQLLAAAEDVASPGELHVRAAARTRSRPRLGDLAQHIEPRVGFTDIVLPDDRIAQLREITAQAFYRDVIYDQWGFGEKVTLGRGVAVLFVGEPGTGKTMAAEVIAHELGLDLYKIDLSSLVSKYIGETEKNLSRVFDEARQSDAILFFDEADALFGKRTEVRDSHDRYANIEVSYLLQKIEEYEGLVVLASNLRANLDDAFLRRLKAIVDFPFPEENDRLRIFQRMLEGTSAPLDDDLDLPYMAREFRMAGGSIKNVVILAAFLAAEEGSAIAMRHLLRATRREFQKLGRLLKEPDERGGVEHG